MGRVPAEPSSGVGPSGLRDLKGGGKVERLDRNRKYENDAWRYPMGRVAVRHLANRGEANVGTVFN